MKHGLLRGIPTSTRARVEVWDPSVAASDVTARGITAKKKLAINCDFLTGAGLEQFSQVNWTMSAGYPRRKKDYPGTRLEYPTGGGFRALLTALPSGDFDAVLECETVRAVDMTGIVLTDGVTAGAGNQTVWGISANSTAAQRLAARYTNFTTYQATMLASTACGPYRFWRIVRSGATYYASSSMDGRLFSVTPSFSVGFTPTYIGFMGANAGAVGTNVGLRSFRLWTGNTSYIGRTIGQVRTYPCWDDAR
jgi:hypothetical protein